MSYLQPEKQRQGKKSSYLESEINPKYLLEAGWFLLYTKSFYNSITSFFQHHSFLRNLTFPSVYKVQEYFNGDMVGYARAFDLKKSEIITDCGIMLELNCDISKVGAQSKVRTSQKLSAPNLVVERVERPWERGWSFFFTSYCKELWAL